MRVHVLSLASRRPTRLGILTAYFGPETFDLIDDVVSAGASAVEVVLAANSPPRAAWEAARNYSNSSVELRVARSSPGAILHPKLIVADLQRDRVAVLGSSNFTSGGFWGNVEVNVSLLETPPLEASSAVEVLHRVFADAFGVAITPSRALWNRLIAAAPIRVPTRTGRGGQRLPSALSQLPEIGAAVTAVGRPASSRPRRPPRTRPAAPAATPRTYTTLLFQLSDADVNRPTWQPAGVGTAQPNLPRESLPPLGITAAYTGNILVEAVGVGIYAGTSEVHQAGLWQRAARGPGRVPEAARFTFKTSLKEFIKEDIGSPAEGDVCVLEVPTGGVSTANPIRVAVIPKAVAASLNLLPSGNRRGTDQPLFWEVRSGTVL